jgi:Flp pilus assembly protein TadG
MRYAGHGERRVSSRRGAAALELAVLLPLLGLVFAAAADFGRVYNVTQTLQDCAFAGAMYASGTVATSASLGPSGAATNAALATGSCLSPPLQSSNVSVVIDNAAGTATVTVTYEFPLVTPVLGPSGTVSLQRTAVMNIAPIPGT